jgi:DNA (cytosine-5)-methyltransferase 1
MSSVTCASDSTATSTTASIGANSAELSVYGLFAGIGGIEEGLRQAGHHAVGLCEIDNGARAVLREHFGITAAADVINLKELESVDVVAAGFPCQDLSQAGGKRGITGTRSSLVDHVFRLLEVAARRGAAPRWVLIENVSYMLRLERGRAMDYLTARFEALGYTWAYRVVDARGFGIPQRRQRVILLAALEDDPRSVLFADDAPIDSPIDEIGPVDRGKAYGFYWTEGKRGLGWAEEAVPTIKGGSRLGIPSPPAVWRPSEDFVGTPTVEDAERLQGFHRGWTEAAEEVYTRPRNQRWTLIGNAVCVPMAEWLGRRLSEPGHFDDAQGEPRLGGRWPLAAWGHDGKSYSVAISMRPLHGEQARLSAFLDDPLRPLSARATGGFLKRARSSSLRFSDGFLDSLERHLAEAN